MNRDVWGHQVRGVDVDHQTRCRHWHGETDIIAIRFWCCGQWYPCHDCHAELADHAAQVWPPGERDSGAVLCGACGHELTVAAYLGCESRCPACMASFNPGCALHFHLYFATAPG